MPILNCVFSSGRHIYGILFVGVCFLGVQHVKPAVILLLQCHASPTQQSNAKYQFGIGNMLLVLHSIQLLCPKQGHNLLGMVRKLAARLVFWHILLNPFLTIVDTFVYIFVPFSLA